MTTWLGRLYEVNAVERTFDKKEKKTYQYSLKQQKELPLGKDLCNLEQPPRMP